MEKKELLLREYKPKTELVLENNTPSSSKFPVIDAHAHIGNWKWDSPIGMPKSEGEWQIQDIKMALEIMDEMNIKCTVNLDGGWGDILKRNLARYKDPYPNRFVVFAWIDWSSVDEPGFGEKWAKDLEKSVELGASGLKVFKTLGLEYRDKNGKLIMPDDTRLDPIWEKAGELKIPITFHTADPVAFFWPLDETNERWEELFEHPTWHFHGKDFPPFMDLITKFLNVVERHPNTNFIGAHIMSYSENLTFVSKALDRYSNLYVDITERIGELGRQPYSSRKFLTKYADRVLFGTDTLSPDKSVYQVNFRFLETEDEYFDYGRNQGRWKIYGMNLPDEVLKKIYYENAMKIIPGVGI